MNFYEQASQGLQRHNLLNTIHILPCFQKTRRLNLQLFLRVQICHMIAIKYQKPAKHAQHCLSLKHTIYLIYTKSIMEHLIELCFYSFFQITIRLHAGSLISFPASPFSVSVLAILHAWRRRPSSLRPDVLSSILNFRCMAAACHCSLNICFNLLFLDFRFI